MSSNTITGSMTLNVDVLIRDIKFHLLYERLNSLERQVLFKPTKDPRKSTALASRFGNFGNDKYKDKNFWHAKLAYTKCISHALENSEELCIAYSNRSAALFVIRKYEQCLLDINRALKTNYCPPNFIMQALLDRKKKCLAIMKSSAGVSDLAIDEDATNPPPIDDREPSWRADLLSKFGNTLLPNASPKIKLKYNKEWGRHFVATANIKPGEPLISEDYFAAALFTDNSTVIYCDFCLTFCDALIPCPSCARTMYCSENCRNQAYDSYHRLECKLSFLFPSPNSAAEIIAIRMFLTGTKQGAALENLMNTLEISEIFVENFDFTDKYTASDYLTALRLPHGAFDQIYMNESIIKRAAQVVSALQLLAFFECVPVDRLEYAEVFATALFLNNHCGQFLFKFCRHCYNCDLPIVEERNLCHGLVLLQSFLNHSCFPNVATYNMRKKREQILFAMRPIKEGEQLFIAYGVDFVISPKAERTRRCSTFTCRCEACSNNWPTYSESGFGSITSLPSLWKRIIDDKVPSISTYEFFKVLQKIKNIVAPLLDNITLINFRVDEILPIVAEIITLLHEVMVPPSFCLFQLRDFLLYFIELYYDECRRANPTQIENLMIECRLPDKAWMGVGLRLSAANWSTQEINCVRGVDTLLDIIYRLQVYKSLYVKE